MTSRPIVDENAANSTSVTNLNDANTGDDTDADGNALTYTITVGNGAGIFAINPSTGEITVSDNTNLDYETTAQHVLTVQASDGTRTDTASVTIDVNNLNDNDPLINDITTDVNENSANSTSVTNLDDANTGNDTDVDGDALTYAITTGNGSGIFTISSTTGEITVFDNTNLDYESVTQHVLTVQANDGTRSDTASVTIDVNDLNDNDPVINDVSTDVDENAPNSTIVVNLNDANTGNDTDGDGDALTYSITAGNSAGIFAINSSTGVITVDDNTNLDHESATQYTLTVQASDGTGSDTASVTIDINNLNDNDPLINDVTTDVDENAANSTSLVNINDANTGNDTDADGEALTYSIVAGNGAGIFAINSSTGEITVSDNANLDYEIATQHVLTVQASDGTRDDTAQIFIDVDNVNDSGPLLDDELTTIAENVQTGFVVLDVNDRLTTTDVDVEGDAIQYSITSGNDAGIFAIDVNDGVVVVADATQLDYEIQSHTPNRNHRF